MAQILVHGTLHITVFEAASLVNESRLTGSAPKFLRKAVEGAEESVGFGKGSSALYATIDLERQRVGRTRIVRKEPVKPVWNESFHIYCAHNAASIVVSVKEDLTVSAFLLGRAKVPVVRVMNGHVVEGWFDLYNDAGKKLGNSRVRLRIQFLDACKDDLWGRGIVDRFPGVPFTYFPQRKGCKITLYQDAHMPDNYLPKIYMENNVVRKPTRCWEDVYEAIMNAKHFIYITGWSVYPEIRLIRDPQRPVHSGMDVTLGELLKRRANEGVKVLLLVWDDRTSNSMVRMDGLMATHDEETMVYFRDSNVKCVLCPRNPDSGLSYVKGFQIGTMFTHHQKSIIVDAPQPGRGGSGERRVVSFVGGIDLCDGRYDTQFHPLFRTLGTVHKDDFHQPNYTGATIEKGGPREPWHDIHSKVEGPAAWDVLRNFEQRWAKQGGGSQHLVPIKLQPSQVTYEDDPDTWNVQIFRSIDGGAVTDFPEDPQAAAAAGLVSGKDCTIDRSIQDAYIHAIRRAKNFIYIENQYFIGGSFAWDSDQDAEAHNVIPRELALKIVRKIEAGERFSVYIVVPMWPEGAPETGQVQAILDWQKKTMQMMYKGIAQVLKAKGINNVSPRDYLSFYCLGNRERRLEGEYLPKQGPDADSGYKSAQDKRRFMIYVHSKLMIVDDEYIIVGSANINQRSMDGGKDTEIAMGAYQPFHVVRQDGPARGEIHGFRMSLWYEHLGMLDDVFLQPSSVECMRKVNRTADELWRMYAGDPVVDLPGHLLTYPVGIASDGTVQELPGCPKFKDTNANILGVKSDMIPPILTT